MIYYGETIEDCLTTRKSYNVKTVKGTDYIELDKYGIEELKQYLDDNLKFVQDVVKDHPGIEISGPKIRITTYEGHDSDGWEREPYSEIDFVWLQSESYKERELRIEREKAQIDKKIKKKAKDAEMQLSVKETKHQKRLKDAMDLLRANGFNVEPPM